MNDDFLYELRNNPPAEFATRLKAQLERQTVEMLRKQRAFRWAAIAAMLVGSTALAFVSPALRQATLTMIVQLRGGEPAAPLDPELQRLIEQKDARASQRIMPEALVDPGQSPAEAEWRAASGRAAPDAAKFATRPDAGSAVAPPAASGGTVVGGARGRSTLRLGHSPSLTAAAQRIASNLENKNPNLDVVLSPVAGGTSTCVRSYPPDVDAWIGDNRATQSSNSCRGGKRFIEVPFAYDAVVLMTHRENTWAKTLSLDDLRRLNERDPSNPLLMWSQVRSEWPTLPITLVGTSPQASEVGKRFAGAVRLNAIPSTFVSTQDDRATSKYVFATLGALGYIDFATFDAELRDFAPYMIASIVNDKGEAVAPDTASIREGRYPLSRPLWLYVDENRLARGDVWVAIDRLMNAGSLDGSGLIALGADAHREATYTLRRF
jgi:phosphate transport system substrate-binding protein